MHWFGESEIELNERLYLRNIAWSELQSLAVNKPLSGTLTPIIGTVGLGLNIPSGSGFLDVVEVSNKLSNISSTPSEITPRMQLGNLPIANNPFDDAFGDAITRLNSPE
jgi:hypothetical protein